MFPDVEVKVKLPAASPFETSSSWERCVSEVLRHEPGPRKVKLWVGVSGWVGLEKQPIDLISALLHDCKLNYLLQLTKLSPFTQRQTDEGVAGAGPGSHVPFRAQYKSSPVIF